jgi:hypothetical protein
VEVEKGVEKEGRAERIPNHVIVQDARVAFSRSLISIVLCFSALHDA